MKINEGGVPLDNKNQNKSQPTEAADKAHKIRHAKAIKARLANLIRRETGFNLDVKHGSVIFKEIYDYEGNFATLYWVMSNKYQDYYCMYRACYREGRPDFTEFIRSGFLLDIQVPEKNLQNPNKIISIREWEVPNFNSFDPGEDISVFLNDKE